jgi:hypothetical protein
MINPSIRQSSPSRQSPVANSAPCDIIEPLMAPTATYLYCVVKSGRRPVTARAPRGIAGATAPAAAELGGSLWLIVADAPLEVYGPEPLQRALGDMQWVSDAAIAHDAVVEHFSRRPDAVTVPMKMFTMFSTRDRAVAEMRARRRELEPVIKRIAGSDEWGVRVMRTSAGAPADRRAAASPSGAAFLAAKRQVRDDRRRDDVPPGAATPPLLDATFLVPAARRTRFKAVARKAAAMCVEAGASMTLTGPWPAYHFVQLPDGRQ